MVRGHTKAEGPEPLCIQDNRFGEYLMKSLRQISIFYQRSRKARRKQPQQRERVKPVKDQDA